MWCTLLINMAAIKSFSFVPDSFEGGRIGGNPCQAGYAPGLLNIETLIDNINLQNITMIICSPRSYRDDSLAIGISSGAGVIILLLILYRFYKNRKAKEEFIKYTSNHNSNNTYYNSPSTKEHIFNMLGNQLHRDYLVGNLTEELKNKLNTLSIEDLKLLESHCNKNNISMYISQEIFNNENIELNINKI